MTQHGRNTLKRAIAERLELDRFYVPNVAFEFNVAQHYRRTARFSQKEADAQHLREDLRA